MGLFDGKAKKQELENQILQAMSELPLLENLIQTVLTEEDALWFREGQNYYDECVRKVTIAKDLFQIKWSEYTVQNDQRVENVYGEQNYSYTASGYMPLHAHVNEKGKEDLSVQRVMYLWASIVRERMQAALPECGRFSEVKEEDGYVYFTYMVPRQVWKSWF